MKQPNTPFVKRFSEIHGYGISANEHSFLACFAMFFVSDLSFSATFSDIFLLCGISLIPPLVELFLEIYFSCPQLRVLPQVVSLSVTDLAILSSQWYFPVVFHKRSLSERCMWHVLVTNFVTDVILCDTVFDMAFKLTLSEVAPSVTPHVPIFVSYIVTGVIFEKHILDFLMKLSVAGTTLDKSHCDMLFPCFIYKLQCVWWLKVDWRNKDIFLELFRPTEQTKRPEVGSTNRYTDLL